MIHLSVAASTLMIMSAFLSVFAGGILLYSKFLDHKKNPH